ncbi:hypothetical protein [Dongshaea marina]|uniref:hypothetical protein n=1 Tax=Dongshaea marina TaxID=2047966 RepID=UPI000D3E699F|nr:hypothetical protein [Dongshaea marina]
MIRWLCKGVAVLLGLMVIGVFLMLVTATGSQLIWKTARWALPELKGELVQGSVISGWQLRDLSFDSPKVQLNLGKVQLEWQLSRLFEGKLTIHKLALQGLNLELKTAQKQDKPVQQSESSGSFSMPIEVELQRFSLKNAALKLPGQQVNLDHLSIQARLDRQGLRIISLMGQDLKIHLAAATGGDSVETYPRPEGGLSRLQLPWLQAPLPIELERLQLDRVSLWQGAQQQFWQQVGLVASWRGSEISVPQLWVWHGAQKLRLEGRALLLPPYMVNLKLTARNMLPDLQG